jgi:hypothetical protein
MEQHILEVFSPGLIVRRSLVSIGNAMPPRDPDEHDDEEEEDLADEPPVVRGPDED